MRLIPDRTDTHFAHIYEREETFEPYETINIFLLKYP